MMVEYVHYCFYIACDVRSWSVYQEYKAYFYVFMCLRDNNYCEVLIIIITISYIILRLYDLIISMKLYLTLN